VVVVVVLVLEVVEEEEVNLHVYRLGDYESMCA
jgi:hypothetical protein